MGSAVRTKKIRIGGMTCISCQNKIEKKLRNTAGIEKAEVSYSAGTAVITFDTDIISYKSIVGIIEGLDYEVLTEHEQHKPDTSRAIGILIIIASLYMLIQQFGLLNLLSLSQLADEKMGYGIENFFSLSNHVSSLHALIDLRLFSSDCIFSPLYKKHPRLIGSFPSEGGALPDYSTVITETGQPSCASTADCSADSGTSSTYASAGPSSPIRNTSGQTDAHSPHSIQPSLSTVAFISITPFPKISLLLVISLQIIHFPKICFIFFRIPLPWLHVCCSYNIFHFLLAMGCKMLGKFLSLYGSV